MKLFEIISVFTYGISKLFPKKKNRWIFGAWFGNAISDNPKALYDYIKENHPEIEQVWVVADPTKVSLPGCKVLKRNSISSLKYILSAEVAIMNQGFGDFAAYNFLGGVYKVQLWHGVAWKKIGRDAIPDLSAIHDKVFRYINHYDLYIAPSKVYGESLKTAFNTNDEHILYVGQPRNDVLFSEEFRAESRKQILDRIGQSDKKIIVYMPTFRDKTSEVFSFHSIEDDLQFKKMAKKHEFVVVEKLHYKSQLGQVNINENKRVYNILDIDATTLLGAADILITDYSSCFFDFLITDRPVIHYAYDYEYYKNKDRGLYYDIEDVAAGIVARKDDELIKAIDTSIQNDTESERRNRVRSGFITYESGHNCEMICKEIQRNLDR